MPLTKLPTVSPMIPAEAAFDAANAGLRGRVEGMLSRYCADDDLHARLLNTLSLLEHIGSRKIMATQSGRSGHSLDRATLRHLAEETRHADYFKRLAEKAARRSLDYAPAGLAAPARAMMYFQRLDAATVRALPRGAPSRAAYLYMSLVVEFRAVWFYRLHQAVMQRLQPAFSLRGVLAEEQGHLGGMVDALQDLGIYDEALLDGLCAVEGQLFERLLGGLEDALL
jgi:hypothetical protein